MAAWAPGPRSEIEFAPSALRRTTIMRDKSIAILAFAMFQLTTATLFLRPAELFVWMADWPIYECLILATLALTLHSVQAHFRRFMLMRQPITLCVVGVFLAISLSHLQNIYIGGAIDSGTLFLKTLIYYGLLITSVNSPSRLKAFLLNVAICASTMVTLCVLDFYNIYDFTFIEHVAEWQGEEDEEAEEGEEAMVYRMRGTGIFMDPNDLAMVIGAAGVLCTYFLTDPAATKLRFGWLLLMLVLLIGLLSTKSRGGLLACGLTGLTLLSVRFGGKIAVVAVVMAVCLLPFAAGRQADIDLEGGTGQERIQLWRDGFAELKSAAILFGTGQGSYADIAGLVAHNSFIHAYVELGLFGGTLFFGCFFFAGMQLYRLGRLPAEEILHPELIRMRPYLCALLAGWVTSMFSLSRCYVVPTYLVLGLMAAYLNLIWIYNEGGEPLVIWNKGHAVRLTFASAATFTGLYVFTAIMAR